MTAQVPTSRADAVVRDGAEVIAAVAPYPECANCLNQQFDLPPDGLDPFVAFTEWAGSEDEQDYADL